MWQYSDVDREKLNKFKPWFRFMVSNRREPPRFVILAQGMDTKWQMSAHLHQNLMTHLIGRTFVFRSCDGTDRIIK